MDFKTAGSIFQASKKTTDRKGTTFLKKLLGKPDQKTEAEKQASFDEADIQKIIYIATADEAGFVKIWSFFPPDINSLGHGKSGIDSENIICESTKRCHLSNITSMKLSMTTPVHTISWKSSWKEKIDFGDPDGSDYRFPVVQMVAPGSKAEQLGLMEGDRILTADGHDTSKIMEDAFIKELEKGSTVLSIKRKPDFTRRKGTKVYDDLCILTSSWDRFTTLWWPSLDPNSAKTLPHSNRHDNPPAGRLNPGGIDSTRHRGAINAACWRPGKDEVLTCADDCFACLWEACWNPEARPPQVAKLKLIFHDQAEGHSEPVTAASFDKFGKTVLTCSQDSTIMTWDVKAGFMQNKYVGHKSAVWSAVFDSSATQPDTRILSASQDGKACVWRVQGARWEHTTEHDGPVFGAIWCPGHDDLYLSFGSDCTARLNDIRLKVPAWTFSDHSAGVWSARFGHVGGEDSLLLCTVSHDMTALVYDLRMDRMSNVAGVKSRCLLTGHHGILWSACFSPDDRYVLTTSEDSTAKIWDISSGEQRPEGYTLMDPDSPHQQCVSFGEFINPDALLASTPDLINFHGEATIANRKKLESLGTASVMRSRSADSLDDLEGYDTV